MLTGGLTLQGEGPQESKDLSEPQSEALSAPPGAQELKGKDSGETGVTDPKGGEGGEGGGRLTDSEGQNPEETPKTGSAHGQGDQGNLTGGEETEPEEQASDPAVAGAPKPAARAGTPENWEEAVDPDEFVVSEEIAF